MLSNLGYLIPLVLVMLTACIMLVSKKPLGDAFLSGAKEGMETSFSLIPAMVMLIACVRMFCASGALDVLNHAVTPVFRFLGVPNELLPVVLVRPFSGSASTAIADSLFKDHGADSFAGKCASVLMGSSDTIVYTLFLYFGSVGIKKTRYAFPVSVIVLLFCTLLSVKLTELML